MFDEHPAAGQTPSFKGSMLMVVAESKEEVMELIRKDIYSTSGVWDLENCQVIPVGFLPSSNILGFCCRLRLGPG